MKIYVEKEKTLQVDENTKLVLINSDDFISLIKRKSENEPAGGLIVNLKYKLINNDNEYEGESTFDSYQGISSTIDKNAPYNVELTNWNLSDKEEKYLEFNVVKKN